MVKKITRIAEWVIIGLFIAIVASIASIMIYHSIVNSDWYSERQTKKSFSQVVKKVNEADNIQYIKVDDNTEERFVYDIPEELFDDLSAISYVPVENVEEWIEIWSQNCITVFYKDEEATTSFFITDDNELYWVDIKIECPSLLSWFNEVRNEGD